jgi:hypothetical protein
MNKENKEVQAESFNFTYPPTDTISFMIIFLPGYFIQNS